MRIQYSIITLLIFVLTACNNKNKSKSWLTSFNNIGTYSSPRVADLNGDKIPDIILGAGTKEEVHTDSAIIALDGATGSILWTVAGDNQNVGSAIFRDINNDNIPDIFIGGRWAQLNAINGATGKLIWSFYPERKKKDGSDGGWYNFTTPQIIPDQDADGIEDIIIANGGDARAAPGDTNRPVGRLLVLSSASGKILANVTVPDGKETYMSVVCEEAPDKNWNIWFGTGGETIGGHLYRTTLKDIMQGNISAAKILASSETKGFVASPVLADITEDGKADIIINTADGQMLAINGATDSLIWKIHFPGTEAYTMPAPGIFNEDSIPDFFANFAIGVFPKLNRSIRFMVDGKTGKLQYQDTIPAFQYASAVTADIDGDGYDEVVINQSAFKRKQFENVFYSYLFAFDFHNRNNYPLGDTLKGTNLASTPWIDDLDNDGNYDIISSSVKYENAQFDLGVPLGLYVRRFSTKRKMKSRPRWVGFMGSDGYSKWK